jgi:capsular exopolysaccharide synthesis family protein
MSEHVLENLRNDNDAFDLPSNSARFVFPGDLGEDIPMMSLFGNDRGINRTLVENGTGTLNTLRYSASKRGDGNHLDLAAVEHVSCPLSVEQRIFANPEQPTAANEQLRFLIHRLERLRRSRPLRTLVVSSAISGEGKTVLAVNLALAIAQASQKVLLIDGDMRRPGVSKLFGLEMNRGLADCLTARAEFADCARCADPAGLFLIPAGVPSANPLDLLQHETLSNFLRMISTPFDWVIIDSPPLTPFADAHCLGSCADGVLMVARSGLTPQAGFRRAMQSISDLYVAGIVLNEHTDAEHDSYYSQYKRPVDVSGDKAGR